MYKCENCESTFKNAYRLTRHQNGCSKEFKCNFCRQKFKTIDEQLLHEETKHPNLHCTICNSKYKSEKTLKNHYETKHRPITGQKRKSEADEESSNKKIKYDEKILAPTPPPAPPPAKPQRRQNQFKDIIFQQSYNPNSKEDLLHTQSNYKNNIKLELKKQLSTFGQLKFETVFKITFYKVKDDEFVYATPHFNPGTQTVLHEGQLEEKIDFSMQEVVRRVEEFVQLGSGWVYEETSKIDLSVFKYRPQRGGKYICLEKWIANKGAIVNIQNDDNKCFLYCIQAARMYADRRVTKNLQRPKQYRDHFHELDYAGFHMPMSLEDIRKFEKRNNLTINIYKLTEEKDRVLPLQISKFCQSFDKIINLLLLEENGNSHYTWIKNFDRLLHPKGSVIVSFEYFSFDHKKLGTNTHPK